MPFQSRFHAFAAKVETTPGVDAAPSMATDAIRLLQPGQVEEFYQAENRTDDVSTGGVGVDLFALPSGRGVRLTLTWVPIGAGVAYGDPSPVPEGAALLRSAGFAESIDDTPGAEQVVYLAEDAPQTTITALFQISGLQYKATGCVTESFRLSCDAGSFPVIEQVLVGRFAGPTSKPQIDPADYDEVVWPIFASNQAVQIGTVNDLVVRSMSLDLGIEAEARTNGNVDGGFAGLVITRRPATLEVVAEVPDLGTWNPSDDWATRVKRALSFRFGQASSAGQYKRVNVVADAGKVVSATDEDLNGIRVWRVGYLCTRPADPQVEQELAFVFD